MTASHPVEADVKAKVRKILKKYGWFFFAPGTSKFGVNGVSDTLALKNGRFLALEIKLDKPHGTPLQEAFMTNIRDNGGTAMLVNRHNLAELEQLFISLG